MANTYKNVSHCIFDMDGLLLDTEQRYTTAFNRVVSKYGKTFTWEHKAALMGFQTMECANKLIELLELPIGPEQLLDQLVPHYEQLFPQSQMMPDSESVYKIIYNKIVDEFGYKYEDDLAFQVLGRPEKKGAQLIIDYYKLPLTVEQFLKKYHQLQHELFDHIRIMPGAERLLKHLHEHNIPIALATSSSEPSYELKTKQVKPMFELFHHRVLGSSDPEVKNGKPAPDIFLIAAKRFPDNPDPSNCLVFEDAPNGVEAAVSAGMQVVQVPDPNLPKNLTEKATMVIQSLQDFKPELFGLPPF